jgi:hypothetical protein
MLLLDQKATLTAFSPSLKSNPEANQKGKLRAASLASP